MYTMLSEEAAFDDRDLTYTLRMAIGEYDPPEGPFAPSPSETTGLIFEIQSAFGSPAGELSSDSISFTSVQPLTSQVRSKVRFCIVYVQKTGSVI